MHAQVPFVRSPSFGIGASLLFSPLSLSYELIARLYQLGSVRQVRAVTSETSFANQAAEL